MSSARIRNLHKAGSSIRQRCGEIHGFDGTVPGCGTSFLSFADLEYKEFFEDNTSYLEETAYLYGSMTYLATRQPVDIDLCTAFMEGIRDQGEELAKRSGKMIDAVTSVNNGTEDLLKRAEELACANYILYSYQYTEILEEFFTLSDGQKQRFRVLLSGRGKNVGLSSSDRPTGLPHRKTLDIRSVLCF